jgi:hypothetical protein
LNEWQRPEILSVQIQQIECDEDALPLSEKQIAKRRPARIIEAANFAIEHGAINAEMFSNPRGKLRETMERIPISRNQFPSPVLDVSQRPEAVELQFINEQVGVERSERREAASETNK